MGDDKVAGYKRLLIFQRTDALAFEIYQLTKDFPDSEKYALTSQLRRAALSVPTNIAEGYARYNDAFFKTYLQTAFGSLAETEYLLDFAHRMSYLDSDSFQAVNDRLIEARKMLWNFITTVRNDAKANKKK